MSDWDQYVCTLTEASAKKAKEELNEDPKERENAVKTFLQWIEQNSSWLKTPTDTKFLLRFLRSAKFAQLAARRKLVNYWAYRTELKDWFRDLDTVKDEKLVEVMKVGNFTVLPKRDADGCAIIFIRIAAIDTSGKYTMGDILKAAFLRSDNLLMDENVQVNGYIMVQDMTDLTIKHQTFFGVEPVKKSMTVWLKGYPARYKAMHYYNTNPVFDAIFALIKPIMPEKLRRRIYFHGKNLSGLYKLVDPSCLPREYIPDDFKGACIGNLQQCLDGEIKSLQSPEVRDLILRLSSTKYGVVEALRPKDDELFNESFKKLNVE